MSSRAFARARGLPAYAPTNRHVRHDSPHVFRSRDDGVTWTEEAGGVLHTTSIGAIAWQGDDVYLGSAGQGILTGVGFDA